MSTSDRRTEPRVRSQGTGQLTVGGTTITVDIIDVSRSGVQIELDQPMEVTTPVELRLGTLKALGPVEYCRPLTNGRYRAGILMEQVIAVASS